MEKSAPRPRRAIRDCFICHATEDKDAIARPVAESLVEAGFKVWFDEFEVGVGDSLTEAIDEGLATSRFGVVILSPRFFEKKWTKRELAGLTAKEVVGDHRVILPIWHGLDEAFLLEVSPPLADRVAAKSSEGLGTVVARIVDAMERLPRNASGRPGAPPAAALPVTGATPEPVEMVEDQTRVRLGYDSNELMTFREGGGKAGGPGWLSVVVGPVQLRDDLIDPTEIGTLDLRNLALPSFWGSRPSPLIDYELRPGLGGFRAKLPGGPDDLPAYEVTIHQDGLMEFGETLSWTGDSRSVITPYLIPTHAVAASIHDWVLQFLQVLRHVGYEGEVAATAAFSQIRGHQLGVERGRDWWGLHPLEDDQVVSRPLVGLVEEVAAAVPLWVRKAMNRLFLAAGVPGAVYFIDEDGNFRG
jgi:hypothetical protein